MSSYWWYKTKWKLEYINHNMKEKNQILKEWILILIKMENFPILIPYSLNLISFSFPLSFRLLFFPFWLLIPFPWTFPKLHIRSHIACYEALQSGTSLLILSKLYNIESIMKCIIYRQKHGKWWSSLNQLSKCIINYNMENDVFVESSIKCRGYSYQALTKK